MHKKKTSTIQLTLDSQLTALLKEDHQRLLEIFDSVMQARYSDNREKTFKAFEEFQGALRGHLLQEDLQIYSFLALQFKNYPGLGEIFVYLYRRMLDNEKKMEIMCQDHGSASTKEWNWELMPDSLERIGDLLKERIEQEEALLYPLYEALTSAGPLPDTTKLSFQQKK